MRSAERASVQVLVTGGAGFIGSHVVDALLARGDAVTVLDLFDDAYDPARKERNLAGTAARVVRGDVRDLATVEAALGDAEVVVHLAARAGVRESLADPVPYASVNVLGTAVVLEAVRRRGARLVFASSSSVYGSRADGAFHEHDPTDAPMSPYAASKRSAELLCHAACVGWDVPATVLRFFTVYGPRQRPSMAIARFVRFALEGHPIPQYGDGSAARDYTYVGDAVRAVLAAADRPLGSAVLNVGGDAPVRLDELIATLGRVLGRELAVERLPEQPGDVPRTHADVTRAREQLGWAPSVSLEQGLRRYVDWVRADRRDG